MKDTKRLMSILHKYPLQKYKPIAIFTTIKTTYKVNETLYERRADIRVFYDKSRKDQLSLFKEIEDLNLGPY